MMKKVDNCSKDEKLVPKEGQRELLSTNKSSLRCPSFGLIRGQLATEDDALEYLADILVEAFFEQYEYTRKNNQ